jgi:hypothetical protein
MSMRGMFGVLGVIGGRVIGGRVIGGRVLGGRVVGGLIAGGAVIGSLAACNGLHVFSAEPQTAGDSPSLNRATSQQVEGVPYCSGGDRAAHCVLGKNCRITEKGCQVCQCAAME